MMSGSIRFKSLAIAGLMRLAGLVAISLICLVLFSPKARAAACNDIASLPPDHYGISTVVRADIYDQRGNFLRHSNDFAFRVTTVDAFKFGYTQAQLDNGIAQWPTGRGGADYRYFTHDFAVNAAQGDNCADAAGPGRRFIFHSEVGTAGWLLDCVWDARNNGTVTHQYDLLAVNDAYGTPWGGYQTQTPGIVVAGRDMNDQPTILIIFRFIEEPHGTIQGYKVDRATLRDPNGAYKNATITATGPRSAANADQPYHLQLFPGTYALTSSVPLGWRLVGYTYNSSYYDLGTGPFGNLNSVPIANGETKDIWFVYDRYYYPWLQSKGGDVISLGKIVGQDIGLHGARNSSSTDKEAENLVISAISVTNFCSTNAYMLGNAGSSGCSANRYVINQDTLPVVSGHDKVIEDLGTAWTKNGSGSGITVCDGPGRFFTQSIGDSGGVINNLPDPNISKVSSGATCDNGVIWQHVSGAKMSGRSFNEGRATYWIKGDLTITGDITRNIKPSGYDNPAKAPNMGIIVEGNVRIDPGVKNIASSIYATGKIYTCSESSDRRAGKCTNSLKVQGSLAASRGFDFGRRYVSTTSGGPGSPAELVVNGGEAQAFPPPGFSGSAFMTNTVVKYLGEKSPRF